MVPEVWPIRRGHEPVPPNYARRVNPRRLFSSVVLIGLGTVLGACSRGEQAPPLDPEMVALGRQVYAESCASSHGAEGKGAPDWQVRNELGELPPPPHDTEGHTWMHSDSVLYETIREGRVDEIFSQTGVRTMPPFEHVLSPREIRAVVTYLKTMWNREQRLYQWEASKDAPFPGGTETSFRTSIMTEVSKPFSDSFRNRPSGVST